MCQEKRRRFPFGFHLNQPRVHIQSAFGGVMFTGDIEEAMSLPDPSKVSCQSGLQASHSTGIFRLGNSRPGLRAVCCRSHMFSAGPWGFWNTGACPRGFLEHRTFFLGGFVGLSFFVRRSPWWLFSMILPPGCIKSWSPRTNPVQTVGLSDCFCGPWLPAVGCGPPKRRFWRGVSHCSGAAQCWAENQGLDCSGSSGMGPRRG